MTVNFSVVGIFYSATVDLGQTGGNTVADVMNYLYRTDQNFYYTSVMFNEEQIVDSFTEVHPDPFQGRTGITYPAGVYRLAQSFSADTPNPYTVWQYYLFDQNGMRVPVVADTSFTVSQVQDGWSIVWRLVTICNAPTGFAKRLRKLLPAPERAIAGVA